MIELSPNLYGVIVPENAERFLTSLSDNVFITYDVGANRFDINTNQIDDIEVLGTASEKEITFDCKPLLEKRKYESGVYIFRNYLRSNICFLKSETKSFLSLIQSKGIELKPNEKLLIIKKL